MNQTVFNPLTSPIWEYRIVGTQDGAGGGDMTLNIKPVEKSRLIPIFIVIGANNYGAGRTTHLVLRTVASAIIVTLIPATSIDNQFLSWPARFPDFSADAPLINPAVPLVLNSTDILEIKAVALSQTEQLTITIRAYILGPIPTIEKTGTGTPDWADTGEVHNRQVF